MHGQSQAMAALQQEVMRARVCTGPALLDQQQDHGRHTACITSTAHERSTHSYTPRLPPAAPHRFFVCGRGVPATPHCLLVRRRRRERSEGAFSPMVRGRGPMVGGRGMSVHFLHPPSEWPSGAAVNSYQNGPARFSRPPPGAAAPPRGPVIPAPAGQHPRAVVSTAETAAALWMRPSTVAVRWCSCALTS